MLSKAYTKIYESSKDDSYAGYAEVVVAGLPEDDEISIEIEGSRVAGTVRSAVLVNYEIVPDVKSWGWSGIGLYILHPIVVKGVITKTTTEPGRRPVSTSTPFTISLDNRKLTISHTAASIIAPKEIYISLRDNLDVDYAKSYIMFHKPLGIS